MSRHRPAQTIPVFRSDAFRAVTLKNYDMSLGSGLSKVADRVFRIGHLGDFNDLMLCGTLAGVAMSMVAMMAPMAMMVTTEATDTGSPGIRPLRLRPRSRIRIR